MRVGSSGEGWGNIILMGNHRKESVYIYIIPPERNSARRISVISPALHITRAEKRALALPPGENKDRHRHYILGIYRVIGNRTARAVENVLSVAVFFSRRVHALLFFFFFRSSKARPRRFPIIAGFPPSAIISHRRHRHPHVTIRTSGCSAS